MKKLFKSNLEEKNKFIFMSHGPDNFGSESFGNSENSENINKSKTNDKFSPKAITGRLDKIGENTNNMPSFVKGPAKASLLKYTQGLIEGNNNAESDIQKVINEVSHEGDKKNPNHQNETKSQPDGKIKGKEKSQKAPEALTKSQKEQIKKYLKSKLEEVKKLKQEYEKNLKKEKKDPNNPGEKEMAKRFKNATKSFKSALSNVDSYPEKKEGENSKEGESASGGGKGAAAAEEALSKGIKEGGSADQWLAAHGVKWNSAKDPWCAAFVTACVGKENVGGSVQGGALNLPKAAGAKKIGQQSGATIEGNKSNKVAEGNASSFSDFWQLKDGTKVATKSRGGGGKGHIGIIKDGSNGGGTAVA